MILRFLAISVVALSFAGGATSALAAKLPEILASQSNAVPECVTPGRLMAFVNDRNRKLLPKFNKISVAYMRHGEELGLRWDYAFFQMLMETNTLKFTGDVRASQNNFAGLGATGGGVRGERFETVSSGVRAHLEHVLMYTGQHIDNPVAERTRKVQSWKILDKWRRTISGPLTYTHLARKWAPPDRGYAADVEALASIFFAKYCNAADPNPALLAEAREGRSGGGAPAVTVVKSVPNGAGGDANQDKTPSAGAATVGAAASGQGSPGANSSGDGQASSGVGRFSAERAGNANIAVLNAPKKEQIAPAAGGTGATADKKSQADTTKPAGTSPSASGDAKTKKEKSATAGAGNGDASKKKQQAEKKSAAGSSTCRVWTASYGGTKALIIKAVSEGITNYTVLDVNAGRETHEANAYIDAYAKGGTTVGEFPSPEKALKRAFEICPNG